MTRPDRRRDQVLIRPLAAGRSSMQRVEGLEALESRFRFEPCGSMSKAEQGSLEGLLGGLERESSTS